MGKGLKRARAAARATREKTLSDGTPQRPHHIRNDAGAATRTRNEASLVLGGELFIYGVIDPYDVRALDVIAGLSELSDRDTINVRINSPGGSVYEGLAMYDALRMVSARGKKVVVRIDALAASIASIVAMAADELVFAEDARLMIHNPFAYAAGEAEDLRKLAAELDAVKARIIEIYTRKAGDKITAEKLSEMMSAETYLSAQEALELGLADRIDEPLRVAARAPDTVNRTLGYLLAPASTTAAPADNEESDMNVRNQGANTPAPQNNAGGVTPPVPAPVVVPPANNPPPQPGPNVAEIENRVRQTVTGIYNAVRIARLENAETVAEDMVRRGITLDEARAEIFDMLAQAQPGGQRQHTTPATVVNDARDKFREGARKGVLARANLPGGERNEFSGMRLDALASESLRIANVRIPHDRQEAIGLAFTLLNSSGPGYHSTSDFGDVLAGVSRAAVMRGFEELPETFQQWTKKGTASDFRPQNRIGIGHFPALDKILESGEYRYGTFGSSGQSVIIATYGKMFAISRQAIINDDLGLFNDVAVEMGRAARRTIGNLVYAVLTANPNMADGIPLFHATHGNLAAGSVPSITSFSAARVAMARQKDTDGIASGFSRPKFVIVPPELTDAVSAVLNSEFSNADTRAPNTARNMVTPIEEARLQGTAYYFVADPMNVPPIEVTYLDGNESPYLEQRGGWHVDGTEFKVRIDAGVNPLDHRGIYKNPGA